MSLNTSYLQNFSRPQFFSYSTNSSDFFNISIEQIKKKGIPAPIINALISQYKHIHEILLASKHSLFEKFALVIPEVNILLEKTKAPHFWKHSPPCLKESRELLRLLTALAVLPFAIKSDLSEEEINQVEMLQEKISELCTTHLVQELNLESAEWSLIPEFQGKNFSEYILYYKVANKWKASFFDCVKDQTPPPIDLRHAGQFMILEQDLSLANDMRLVIDLDWELSALITRNKPLIFVRIIFYMSAPNLHSSNPNVVSLNSRLDPDTCELEEFQIATPFQFPINLLNAAKNKANQIALTFKEEWTALKFPDTKTETFVYPCSSSDWKEIEYQVLLQIAENAQENTEIIEFLAQKTNLILTEEEISAIQPDQIELDVKEEEILISPKAVADIMVQRAAKELKQALEESPEHINSKLNAKLLLDDQQKQQILLKNFKKSNSHQTARSEHKISIKQPATTQQSKMRSSEIALNINAISSDEKEQVRSVFKGHPMKARVFNKFARKLLKKMVSTQSLPKESTIKSNQKGAHPKIHFVKTKISKESISGGVTFNIKHGSNDDLMGVHGQKQTLREILNIQ